jgi:3-phenylpropionate/trans-cinnamate dioxygenase ferredoxin component
MSDAADVEAPCAVLGPVGSIYPGWRRSVRVGQTSVLVHCESDGLFAIENACPHYQVPLDTGRRRGAYQECPWHHWLIDVRTGVCMHNPRIKARSFSVIERHGQHVVVGDSQLDHPPQTVELDGSNKLGEADPEQTS